MLRITGGGVRGFRLRIADLRFGFLGAFAKLRNPTISFVMSVCPSVRKKQLVSHSMDFHKVLHVSIFRKSVEKFHV